MRSTYYPGVCTNQILTISKFHCMYIHMYVHAPQVNIVTSIALLCVHVWINSGCILGLLSWD